MDCVIRYSSVLVIWRDLQQFNEIACCPSILVICWHYAPVAQSLSPLVSGFFCLIEGSYVLISFCWFWTTKLPFLEIHPSSLQYPKWHQYLFYHFVLCSKFLYHLCLTCYGWWPQALLVPPDQSGLSTPFMPACHWFCVHVPDFSVWITVFGALMT